MLRIVIAGPDEALSLWLADALAPAQAFEVVGTALDGESALETVRRTRPDVVVVDVDIVRPPQGGSTLVAAMTDAIPDVVILVLATDVLQQDAQEALIAGASAVLARDGSAQIPPASDGPDSGTKDRPPAPTCGPAEPRGINRSAHAGHACALTSGRTSQVTRGHSLGTRQRTWAEQPRAALVARRCRVLHDSDHA